MRERFEANMLDGDSVDDCGGCMLNAKEVLEYFKEAIKADQQRMAKVRILKKIAEENAKEGWVCDWKNKNQAKFYVYYNYIDDTLGYDYDCAYQHMETGFYTSGKVVKKLQSELLEDYKMLFRG